VTLDTPPFGKFGGDKKYVYATEKKHNLYKVQCKDRKKNFEVGSEVTKHCAEER